MKNLVTSRALTDPVTVHASIANIAELYAAASAMAVADQTALNGLGDSTRISIITTVGAMRKLLSALGASREAV